MCNYGKQPLPRARWRGRRVWRFMKPAQASLWLASAGGGDEGGLAATEPFVGEGIDAHEREDGGVFHGRGRMVEGRKESKKIP